MSLARCVEVGLPAPPAWLVGARGQAWVLEVRFRIFRELRYFLPRSLSPIRLPDSRTRLSLLVWPRLLLSRRGNSGHLLYLIKSGCLCLCSYMGVTVTIVVRFESCCCCCSPRAVIALGPAQSAPQPLGFRDPVVLESITFFFLRNFFFHFSGNLVFSDGVGSWHPMLARRRASHL